MRYIVITFTVLSLSAVPALAQQVSPAQSKQMRAGTTKIWVGVALAGAGALMMPVTSVTSSSDTQLGVGATFIFAGAVLIVLGGRDRAKASPQTTFGVSVGRSKAVALQRSW